MLKKSLMYFGPILLMQLNTNSLNSSFSLIEELTQKLFCHRKFQLDNHTYQMNRRY